MTRRMCLVREADGLRVELYANGRAKVPVTLWQTDGPEPKVLRHALLDPHDASARQEFAAGVGSERAQLVERLLLELAVELAQREASAPERSDEDQELAGQGKAVGWSPVEPWSDPVDGAELIAGLTAALRRFVAISEEGALAVALWIVHAHALEAFEVSPLLGLTSPEKRCGKTTTLAVIAALVPRPLSTANITAAAVFRTVEKFCPTLLVDEADTFLDDRGELRGILNSGHTRTGAWVLRTVGDDFEPRCFSTWAPKALAKIGRFPDTLADRSIVVSLRRRAPDERIERLRRDRLPAELAPLHRRLLRWVADHLEQLRRADPEVPAALDDRAADNWRPLLAVADLAGGVWPERARAAALKLSGEVVPEDGSVRELLLADLRAIFAELGRDELSTEVLLERLKSLPERQWGDWKAGRPMGPRDLARLLRPFGVRPARFRSAGNIRGYRLGDLTDAFRRYLPPEYPPVSAPSAPSLSDNDLQPPSIRSTKSDGADARGGVSLSSPRDVADGADTDPPTPRLGRGGAWEPEAGRDPSPEPDPDEVAQPPGPDSSPPGAASGAAGPGGEQEDPDEVARQAMREGA